MQSARINKKSSCRRAGDAKDVCSLGTFGWSSLVDLYKSPANGSQPLAAALQ